jgi:hypothetical protein
MKKLSASECVQQVVDKRNYDKWNSDLKSSRLIYFDYIPALGGLGSNPQVTNFETENQ